VKQMPPLPAAGQRDPDAGSVIAAPGPDRRQRKKQLTRDALIQAALELFEVKGYDHTAVHEITDAVDVSERTFFRYFASKEDLALSFVQDRMDAFASALAARPLQEEPLTAARQAFHELHRQLGEDADQRLSYLSVMRLIDSTPTLLAAHLRYIHNRDDEIVRVLAEREGVDPVTDRRPRLLAAMIGALVYLADSECRVDDSPDPDMMAAAFDAYADVIASALTGHWTAR
jgi:AcrR family transcriptional regulator